jgi:hypothetical protein
MVGSNCAVPVGLCSTGEAPQLNAPVRPGSGQPSVEFSGGGDLYDDSTVLIDLLLTCHSSAGNAIVLDGRRGRGMALQGSDSTPYVI